MSKWVITDGATGRLCILPIGQILDARLPYCCAIHKEVECHGLLEAMRILHEYEEIQSTKWISVKDRLPESEEHDPYMER